MAGQVENGQVRKGEPSRRIAWLAGVVALLVVAPLLLVLLGVIPLPRAVFTPAATPVPATTGVIIPGMPSCYHVPSVSSTPGETPQPSPTATGSVFGLAWFHKPPEDGTTARSLAGEHRYIHLTGAADIPFRDELRDAGYEGPIYTYVTAISVEGPGPYKDASARCDTSYTAYDNNVAWRKGDFCEHIHPNESWFLHNGKGERLVDDYFGTERWSYLMNPADPGWQAFFQSRAKEARDEWGYSGIWLDNLDLDLSRATEDADNGDGRVQEYADDAQWREGMKSWLSGLRASLGDWPIWANLVGGAVAADAWDPYAPYLDGAMDESFAVRWLDEWRSPEEWSAQVERADRWLQSEKGLVMVGQGARDSKERLCFTLASYMLVAHADNSFYRYTRFDTYYRDVWLYPEFDIARSLGLPTGPRQETSPGVWRRQFDNGYVEVDVHGRVGSLVPTQP
ncbi:MAG TPA: putative glycoside hydrolase [Chloroflexia bacterium]